MELDLELGLDPGGSDARALRAQLRADFAAATRAIDAHTRVDIDKLCMATTRFLVLTNQDDTAPPPSTSALATDLPFANAANAAAAQVSAAARARRLSRAGFATETTATATALPAIGSPALESWTPEMAHKKYMAVVGECVSHLHHRQHASDAAPPLQKPADDVVYVIDKKGTVRTIARYAASVQQVRESAAVAAAAGQNESSLVARRKLKGTSSSKVLQQLKQQQMQKQQQQQRNPFTNDVNDTTNQQQQMQQKPGTPMVQRISMYLDVVKRQDAEITRRVLAHFKGNQPPSAFLSPVAIANEYGVTTLGISSPSAGADSAERNNELAQQQQRRRQSIAAFAPVQHRNGKPTVPVSPVMGGGARDGPLSMWQHSAPLAAIGVLQLHPIERPPMGLMLLADAVRQFPAFAPFGPSTGANRTSAKRKLGGNVPDAIATDTVLELCRVAHIEYFRPGELVFSQGDTGTKWYCFFFVETKVIGSFAREEHNRYVLLRGAVEIQIAAIGSATRMTVATLGYGQGFGELALVNNNPRAATVVAAVPDVILPVAHEPSVMQGMSRRSTLPNIFPALPPAPSIAISSPATATATAAATANTTAPVVVVDDRTPRPLPDDLIALVVDKADYVNMAREIHSRDLSAKQALLASVAALEPFFAKLQEQADLQQQQQAAAAAAAAALEQQSRQSTATGAPAPKAILKNTGRPLPDLRTSLAATEGIIRSSVAAPSEMSSISSLSALAAVVRWKTCGAGETILREGENAHEFYFIRHGYVDIFRSVSMEVMDGVIRPPTGNPNAKMCHVNVRVARKGPGDVLGESWVVKYGMSDYVSRWAHEKQEDTKTICARFECIMSGQPMPPASRARVGDVPSFPSAITARVAAEQVPAAVTSDHSVSPSSAEAPAGGPGDVGSTSRHGQKIPNKKKRTPHCELAAMSIFDGQTRIKSSLLLSNYLSWDDDKLRAMWHEDRDKNEWRKTRTRVLNDMCIRVSK
ncbi:hypothetical protein BC828DRAFT_59727 [Blastocladiella britannica]|nr:hypothetical protein BC828DRAFT_59727 [Blastocladiella britannica]